MKNFPASASLPPPAQPPLPSRLRQMSSSQASELQTTTLSQPSGSRAYRPWQKEELERLVGWIEEHADLMQGKRKDWSKQAKEEVFSTSLDYHISLKKIVAACCVFSQR